MRTVKNDTISYGDSLEFCFFFVNFQFFKESSKIFYLDTYCACHSLEKFSLPHDRHASGGIFLITFFLFFLFCLFFYNYKLKFPRNSERSEAEGRAREQRKAEGPELRPGCKALGYWDDKSEENILRTTTDDDDHDHDGQQWYDVIRGFPRIFLFFVNFWFFKESSKMFSLYTYIVFPFYSFEKFSLIHDRHTSVSRWGHFLNHFFFCFFCFVCFLLFFVFYLQFKIFS